MTLNLKKSVSLLGLALVCSPVVAQSSLSFHSGLLKSLLNGQDVDLSYFEQGFSLLPSVYSVDVYINKQLYKRLTLEFKVSGSTLVPVLTKSLLKDFGLKIDEIDALKRLSEKDEIFPVIEWVPNSSVHFDGPNLRLDLSFPQIYMVNPSSSPNDVVSPSLWDNGVTAGMLNYSLTGSHFDYRKTANGYGQNLNLLLNAQFNVGAWRLFTNGTFSYSKSKLADIENSQHDWDYWNAYLQRDVVSLKSTLKVGEISTVSDVFDNFSMHGLSLGTNEQMLPSRDRSFMPTITGFANTYAQVFIKQDDRIVYQMNVPPGPWKLDQIPTLSNDGDLTVIVRESDGTERQEVVPYTSVPLMLREGQFRYNLNVGKYHHSDGDSDEIDPYFGQLTVLYGLPWDITLFGGAFVSRDYQALAAGAALSLGYLGAISFDAIHARVDAEHTNDNQSSFGTAYRIRYEKSLPSTGTSVNLATYRYTTKNYLSFSDLHNDSHNDLFDHNRMKQRWQLSVSQSFGDWGYFNGSGNYVSYHDNKRSSKTWNLSYSKSFSGINTQLSYSRAHEKYDGKWSVNDRVMFYVNIPLSKFSNLRSTSLKSLTTDYQLVSTKNDNARDYQHRVGLRYRNPSSDFNWSLSQTQKDNDVRESSLMLGYNGDRLDLSGSYTRNQSQHTYMFSLNGALLAHAGGVTFASRTFDSVALVEVPNVAEVKINQSSNVHTDSFGYAVVTGLRNYSANELVIDPTTLPAGALLLEGTNKNVYPTAGAVTRVVFPVRLGYQALLYLVQKNGLPLPFGVPVVLVEDGAQQEIMSFVGDQGRVYFSGLPKEGHLKAKWTVNGSPVEAVFAYQLPDMTDHGEDFEYIPQLHLTESDNK